MLSASLSGVPTWRNKRKNDKKIKETCQARSRVSPRRTAKAPLTAFSKTTSPPHRMSATNSIHSCFLCQVFRLALFLLPLRRPLPSLFAPHALPRHASGTPASAPLRHGGSAALDALLCQRHKHALPTHARPAPSPRPIRPHASLPCPVRTRTSRATGRRRVRAARRCASHTCACPQRPSAPASASRTAARGQTRSTAPRLSSPEP